MATKSKTSQTPPFGGSESQQEPPSVSPPKKKVDLESHVSGSLNSIPEPSEAAIAAQQARMQVELEGAEDAAAAKAAGKRGPYKAREKGKSIVVKPGESKADKVKIYRQVGYQLADLFLTAGLTLGGEDWRPTKVLDGDTVLYDEKANLREAWADLAEEYQWEKFPPWIAVTIATASYAIPRINAPSTQQRVSKFKLWWDARKMKKQELEDLRKREQAKAAEEARKKADAA